LGLCYRASGMGQLNLDEWLPKWGGRDTTVAGNRVRLLHDGAEAFPAMLADIAAARTEILLEMYWFASDATGRKFAEAIALRAQRGVRVRIIYDAVGSFEADDAMFVELEAAGCEVHQFNPIAPWRQRFQLGLVNQRNHRKLLIVDGQVGYTGGVNLADPWSPEADGGQAFRDTMIRIDGPATGDMRAIFMSTWEKLAGEVAAPEAPVAHVAGAPAETCGVTVLANRYLGGRRAIRRTYLQRIRRARRSVYIANSYFLPDRTIRRYLFDAAARGVDVRVLVPGRSDVPAVHLAARRLYGPLMKGGVRLYEWHETVLHAKTAVIDGEWSTIGTYNLDYRSWRINLEVTAAVDDAGFGASMEQRFFEDLAMAAPVDPRHFAFRPLSERIAEHFFYLFRKLF
jgi:cardiolipin synthase A/B